jgi:hypothetical protein
MYLATSLIHYPGRTETAGSVKYELTSKLMVYSKDQSKVIQLGTLIKEGKITEVHGYKAFPAGVPPTQFQLTSSGQLWLTGVPEELDLIQAALVTVPQLKLLWVFASNGAKLQPRGLALHSEKQILLKAGESVAQLLPQANSKVLAWSGS